MRNARTLLSLVATAIAATAFAASPASAQTMEVADENNGHCSAVSLSGTDVNGGCLTHASGTSGTELRKHVFGIESHVSTCHNEWHARVNENAQGYIFEQVFTGAGCIRQACKDGSGEAIPWVSSGTEGAAMEGSEFLTTNFCIEPVGGGTDESCEIDIPYQSYENQHRTEFGHATEMGSHGISGFRCELVGHWNTEIGGTHDGSSEIEPVGIHVL